MKFMITLMVGLFIFAHDGSCHDGHPEKSDRLELLKVDSIKQFALNSFDAYAQNIYQALDDESLTYEALRQGLVGYHNLAARNELQRLDTITVIDFTQPSSASRLYIIDICNYKIIHKSLCSHGANSGRLYAKHFSNDNNSHQSSLGFYVTTTTYSGKYDLALRLRGMEHSNSKASSRGVVMHGAHYASYEFLEKNGCQLGRSYGCPALPFDGFEQVVSMIKGGSCLFIYYPSRSYKRYSKYLNRNQYLVDFIPLG